MLVVSPSYCNSFALGMMLFFQAGAVLADDPLSTVMQAVQDARPLVPTPRAVLHATPCVNGTAAGYPCSNIDLLAFEPVANFSATSTNSLWGWTDAQSGIEYALVGANNGTAFFSLAKPDHPLYLGKLPTHTGSSIWRDVRVYANHAYVVSDNNGAHGMQVFDLTQLRGVTTPQTFAETTFVGGFGRGHTIAINEATGFAYVAGSDTCPAPTENGGLRMYNLQSPAAPVFVGCIATGGYTHETQCWTYSGPDAAHKGKELCFNANGNSGRIAIVDVSNKSTPITLSSTPYTGSRYTHQGWLTDDQRYFLVNDELDETNSGHNARTYVFDVADLDAPVLVGYHQHALSVIDHNLYVHDGHVFESNYEAGLRILRLGNLSQAEMTEVAYFDVWPGSNSAAFNGNWNNYRFPGSGNVIATGIDEGLFVLQPHLCTPPPPPQGLVANTSLPNRIDLSWNTPGRIGTSWRVERAQGGCGGVFQTLANGVASAQYADTAASGQVLYGYRVVQNGDLSICPSEASACVEAQTTGACTAAPLFSGIASISDAGLAQCRVDLSWSAAQPACGSSSTTYSVYRGSGSGLQPSPANRIASGLTTTSFSDANVDGAAPSYYIVRATDVASGAEDGNLTERSIRPSGPLVDGSFVSGAEPGEPPLDTSLTAGGTGLSAAKHAGWHTSLTRVHGGVQSFWSTAANNLCVTLVSPALTLTSGQSSQLSFWTAWDIEQGWDGGVVEVSTNGGANWTRLTPAGGYPSSISNSGALCGITQGSGAYTGMGHLAWSPASVDLASFAGQNVKLRWLYRTDAGQVGEGWFIDDIAISHAQIPGMCSAPSVDFFQDGFE
jgi:choice-of-anchor B domain-containing protein